MTHPKPATIIRTIVLLLALVNQVCVMLGRPVIAFEEESVTQLVNGLFTVAASVWAWWKNNSFTGAAIKADEVLEKLRGQNT